jgi:hydroxyethylthiazole kinase-like uncharacterized protein yjeF
MKILSAEQTRAWDQATIERQDITSVGLMERAAKACTDWLVNRYSPSTPFIVICGTGNNGGDGLAITRMLLLKGYSAMAFLVKYSDKHSGDNEANLSLLKSQFPTALSIVKQGDNITELPVEIVIIDALFGTGLNRGVDGYQAAFISQLNKLRNEKVAIDVPSGMLTDGSATQDAVVLEVNHTLTLQQYKRAMLHPERGAACGEIHVVDIGLDKAYVEAADSHWYTLDSELARQTYKPRAPFTHKGTHGTAYLIGGTHGLIGAVLLATQAAGRAGAGKVRALVPECGYTVLQTAAPEAMCNTSGDQYLEAIEGWESAKGIGIGPGLGNNPQTVQAFRNFLNRVDRPIIMDADALNLLGEQKDLLKLVPKKSILTPHPKEFERMFGKTDDSFKRAELVRDKARELELIIVAKDRYTIVALPDGKCYYNIPGNAGLATGGSGDVLCGIITGLLAQGYEPEAVALLGVYLHAAAGDIAVRGMGMEALVAGHIVAHIGQAFLTLAG